MFYFSEPCVEFIKKQAESLNLPVVVYRPVNDKNPIAVITWTGSQPNLPSIVLNSHMDVVPGWFILVIFKRLENMTR